MTPDVLHEDEAPIFAMEISSKLPDELYSSSEYVDNSWDHEKTSLMLNSIELRCPYEESQTSRQKRKIWQNVSADMEVNGYPTTPDECNKKWRNMKKRYYNILKRQINGDFMSSRFAHFEQMHRMLVNESDPLGLRNMGLSTAIMEKQITKDKSPSFVELEFDDDVDWTITNVDTLIKGVEELQGEFSLSTQQEVPRLWELVREKLVARGCRVTLAQCQRKWSNLIDGVRFYHGISEQTGVPPSWPYYMPMVAILNEVNVPIYIPQSVKKRRRKLTEKDESEIFLRLKKFKTEKTIEDHEIRRVENEIFQTERRLEELTNVYAQLQQTSDQSVESSRKICQNLIKKLSDIDNMDVETADKVIIIQGVD